MNKRTEHKLEQQISIPSGTIKSSSGCCSNSSSVRFQFLLVRLKVSSIVGLSSPFLLFQFLLVRLKALSCCQNIVPPTLFQFLLVRLKESCFHSSVFFTFISIPSGTIKSVKAIKKGSSSSNFNSFWYD